MRVKRNSKVAFTPLYSLQSQAVLGADCCTARNKPQPAPGPEDRAKEPHHNLQEVVDSGIKYLWKLLSYWEILACTRTAAHFPKSLREDKPHWGGTGLCRSGRLSKRDCHPVAITSARIPCFKRPRKVPP